MTLALLGCVFITEVDRAAREAAAGGDGSDTAWTVDTAPGDSGGDAVDSAGDSGADGDSGDSGGDSADSAPPSDRPELLAVRAGSFWMGTDTVRDTSTFGHDLSSRRVTLTRAFWIDTTEVSDRELRGGSDLPAIEVTWSEAARHANRRSDDDGLEACYACTDETCVSSTGVLDCEGWRLPTEAEWEYAARAGETGEFLGGDLVDGAADLSACDTDLAVEGGRVGSWAWYCANSRDTLPATLPEVPNDWGGYNFTGSVWEWVEDGYAATAPDDDTDPIVTSTLEGRVIRGGDYGNAAVYVRLASRYAHAIDEIDQGDQVGFRLVRTCPDDPCP